MKDNIKIFGYSKDNRTYYKLKFDQIEETVVNSVSGKAVFDFLWIDGKDFGTILDVVEEKAPLRRNVTKEQVGNSVAFLLSDMSDAITGQIVYADSGYNIMGI